MNIFSAKSIGLYSVAIGSAIAFFQFITSYGEANIKAPSSIGGNYLINTQNLPDCLQQKQLIFKLQQSGIYLNASIITDKQNTNKTREPRPTFSGKLTGRSLNLSGTVPTDICPQSSQLQIDATAIDSVTLRDRQQLLQGKLVLANRNISRPASVEFTGTLQPSDRTTKSQH